MSKNIFNSVQFPSVGSNLFNLSHDVKLSFKMGGLYPTCAMETLPGDIFTINTETMLRFAPLIAPVMHKVKVTTHYFFVPNRILWSGWEKWITGDEDSVHPFYRIAPTLPLPEGSLPCYLGMPAISDTHSNNIDVNPFPVSAYNLIWNEYYRDQNLQDPKPYALVEGNCNGVFTAGNDFFGIRSRAWMHDYFTSALPWAQKGDAVTLPLGTFEDVNVRLADSFAPNRVQTVVGPAVDDDYLRVQPSINGDNILREGSTQFAIDPNNAWVAETSDLEAQSATINTLRRAFRLQEWLEKNARGGTRYIESILVHFGIKSSDARLQRPEYLGGSKGHMTISEVLSTADTENAPVGQMAGHGISVSGGRQFKYKCEEHGWIIGIINVQPTTAYQQGLHKMFTRKDRLEYYWPSFANIGEQEVLNQEVYFNPADADNSTNMETFGYVPRYAEYKFMNSRVAGEMCSSLSFWHLGRIFDTTPGLNQNFIESNPSTRIFAVEEGDHIYGHIFNNIKAVRKMPIYGTPTI